MKTVRLKDVVTFEKNQGSYTSAYVGLEDIESNTGLHLGSREPRKVKSSTFSFTSEHLLYGRLRPYLNKVLLPSFAGHCSTEIFPIKPSKEISREYLSYWFRLPRTVEAIDQTSTGARMPRANMDAVMEFEIPLPSPERQREIVTKLDSAFSEIDLLEENLDLLCSLIIACDTSILERILAANNSQQLSHRSSSLGEVTKLISRGISPSYLDTASTVILNQRCIRDGHVNFDFARRHNEKAKKVQEIKLLRDGDGLINSTGVGTLGRTALFKKYGNSECTVDSHLTIVRPKSEILNSDYFGLVLRALESVFVSLSTGTSGQTELPREAIKNTSITFPIDLADQVDFYKYYSAMNSALNVTRKLLVDRRALASELRQSLLSRAFTQEEKVA